MDTCFLIDLMQGDAGAVRAAKGYAAEGWTLYAPDIAVYELHRGMAQVDRPDRKWQIIRAVLDQCHRLPLEQKAIAIGGRLEGRLKATGQPIGSLDCMIAAIALRNGMPVVTRNNKDFERITGLDVQTY